MMACRVASMPITAADAKDPAGKLRGSAVPWRRMLLHPAVWAIVVNNYTFHYAFYVVMNWLPTYFEQVRCSCSDCRDLRQVSLSYVLPFGRTSVPSKSYTALPHDAPRCRKPLETHPQIHVFRLSLYIPGDTSNLLLSFRADGQILIANGAEGNCCSWRGSERPGKG